MKSVNKQTVKIIDRSSMLIYNDERQVKIELWRDGGQPTGQCDHAAAAAGLVYISRGGLVCIISISQIMLALCYDLEGRESR